MGISVEIFIPVLSNEGDAFTPEHDAVFTDHLVKLFGGFTLLPGEGSGGWEGPDGKMYREPMRVVMVSAGALIADGYQVHLAALFAKRHYRQEAIFLRYLGQTEVL